MQQRNGSTAVVSEATTRKLAPPLGWFSIGLGAPQVVAPGKLNRLVGIEDNPVNRKLMRAIGLREIASGLGIFTRRRLGLWSRVAGDAMDLALLGAALGYPRNTRARVAVGAASVVGVTVLDVLASLGSTRSTTVPAAASAGKRKGVLKAKTAVTVNKPVEQVYGFWSNFENFPKFMFHVHAVKADGAKSHWVARGPADAEIEWNSAIVQDVPNQIIAWRSIDGDVPNSGSVRFRPAPGNRGTEIVVEIEYSLPGGPLGQIVAKLFGEEPEQQIKDDVRRFKQVLETGEVVVSDGSPFGSRTQGQWVQREAQPAPASKGA
jgi:uncharacterized membrane protein